MQGDNCSSGGHFDMQLGQAGNRTNNLPITRQPALPPDHKQELLQLLRPFEERLKEYEHVKGSYVQTPIPMKLGCFVKRKLKTEYNDLQILSNWNSVDYKIFSVQTDKLDCFCADILSFWIRCLQHVPKWLEQRQQNGKVEECLKKITCLKHSTGEQVNWKQVSAMIGYKRSIPERVSRSQARMGRDSPLCEQLCEQIVIKEQCF